MTDNILKSEKRDYLSLLARLCDADGASGDEDRIRDILIEEVKPYADKLYIDRMGSLIAFKRGKVRKKPLVRILPQNELFQIALEIPDEYFIVLR